MKETLEDKVGNLCFNAAFHWGTVIKQMINLIKIVDPEHCYKGIDYYIKKRDNAKAPHTKAYWNNKIKYLFDSAKCLITNLKDKDLEYLGITKEELRTVLKNMKEKYL